MTPTDFAAALLGKLGDPITEANLDAIVGWEAREGGNWNNTALYNPLNTKMLEPGSTNMSATNNVQAYTSWEEGLDATASTLENGNYPDVLAALKGGSGLEGYYQGLLKWSGDSYSEITGGQAGKNPGAVQLPGADVGTTSSGRSSTTGSSKGGSSGGNGDILGTLGGLFNDATSAPGAVAGDIASIGSSLNPASAITGIWTSLLSDAKYAALFLLVIAVGGFLIVKGISANGAKLPQLPTIIPIPA